MRLADKFHAVGAFFPKIKRNRSLKSPKLREVKRKIRIFSTHNYSPEVRSCSLSEKLIIATFFFRPNFSRNAAAPTIQSEPIVAVMTRGRHTAASDIS